MDKALSYEVLFENGEFLGFKLGRGYSAQQECGIKELNDHFKIDTSLERFGVERRMIKECPSDLRIETVQTEVYKTFGGSLAGEEKEYETEYVLIFEERSLLPQFRRKFELPNDLEPDMFGKKEEYRMAWSEYGFGILTKKDNLHYLETLLDAFKRLDVAIHYDGELYLLIASKLGDDDKELLIKFDEELYKKVQNN
jgi:hypothetical protein